MRTITALVATLSLPIVAHAVPVTWEARGVVDSSTLDVLFFETFMPELVGTAAGDPLVLRIRFDTDAERFARNDLPGGGRTASFDATSLHMALEVPGRGTHVFTIDTSAPQGPHSLIGIVDGDFVDGDLFRDGVQFQHNYLTPRYRPASIFFGERTVIVRVRWSRWDGRIARGRGSLGSGDRPRR